MKKTVILILAILPIFLIITIAFAGKILSLYQHIPVEQVQFVDVLNNPYEEDDVFELNMGDEKTTNIRILPELATNKEVTYESSNEEICTVDKDGKIKGINYGSAQITVTTKDSNKKSVLYVAVKADRVMGITLPQTEVTLSTGEKFKIIPTVELPPAKDKNVTYESNNDLVAKVNMNGEVTAIAEGTATITVTTNDGGYTATCTITVIKGVPALAFTLDEQDFITVQGAFRISTEAEINLNCYIQVDPKKVDEHSVKFYIQSGINYASITEDGVITLKQPDKLVKVVAYVGDKNEPTYSIEVILKLATT